MSALVRLSLILVPCQMIFSEVIYYFFKCILKPQLYLISLTLHYISQVLVMLSSEHVLRCVQAVTRVGTVITGTCDVVQVGSGVHTGCSGKLHSQR